MQVKLSGPGTTDLMGTLQALLVAATEACTAYSMRVVQEMKREEVGLTDLHRKKQKLEAEVRQLEERKRKALSQTQPPQKQQKQPQQEKQKDMREGTKPLTPEEVEAHRARLEAAKALKNAEAEAKAPLKHQPFAALAARVEKSEEAQP